MNKKKIIGFIVLIMIMLIGFFIYQQNVNKEVLSTVYLAGEDKEVLILTKDLKEACFPRGKEVFLSDKKESIDGVEYLKLYIDEETYYCLEENIVEEIEEAIKEKELWVYRTCTTYKNSQGSEISGLILKGEKIDIIGHSEINADGSVNRYKTKDGYVLSKYLTNDESYAKAKDSSTYASNLQEKTNNPFGGGSISDLDYYPNDKKIFDSNVMPEICRTLYLNAESLADIDKYIEYAKTTKVNSFVVDIKDNDVISCKLNTIKEYSPSSYDRAIYTKEEFKKVIDKIKNNGFYVSARITVFKDACLVRDHEEYAILDKSADNKPFEYGGLWPSAYVRDVWQYNVELAKEVIKEFGFNEIQFDYVRFPELIDYFADKLGVLDLRNKYEETRCQAIQRFLMYACDELHELEVYVAADVFGETAYGYVCAYGQYLPAISNVVDVVCPMPYPDHFNIHDFGIKKAVWEVPYELICRWGANIPKQQALIPTPSKVRCYIQGYNSIRKPYVIYDSNKIAEQIEGLIDSDIYDGYIIWNAGSNLQKYESFFDALTKY